MSQDTSISRTHAYLYPAKDHIKIVDNNSKYGSYLLNEDGSEQKIVEPEDLIEGQKIHFGKLDNIWIFSKVEFKTTTSTISTPDKKELLKTLNLIGGSILPQWTDECTHVTMPTLSVTIKVLQALVSFRPIVRPDYWKILIQCIQNKEPLPNCENYIPIIIEQDLNKDVELYKKNPIRSTLFAGKNFIFILTKDLNSYKNIIKSAGGTCESLQNSKIPTGIFFKKNVIVIRPSNNLPPNESQCSQGIDKIEQKLKEKNLRCIPEIEIGLAILHCSLEKYCNPETIFEIYFNPIKYSEKEILARNTVTLESTVIREENSFVLPGSENLNKSVEIVSDVILIDSEMCDRSSSISYKRKNSLELGNASKKSNFDVSVEISVEPSSVDYDCSEINNSRSPEISEEINEMDEIETAPKNPICFDGFINTSQIVHEDFHELPLPGTSQEIMPPPPARSSFIRKASKRLGGTVLSDESDDLFNFEDNVTKKRKRIEEPVLKDLFDFENSSTSKSQPKRSQPKTSKPASRPIAKNTVEMMPIISFCFPVKESSVWLSTTMIDQLKIDDTKIKDEIDGTGTEEDTKSDLFATLNPFKIKVMNVSFKRLDVSVVNNESSINSGKKSFKGFVKKRNYKPQTQIVSTEPYCV